jgi:branched-chain amino acid transport system substrate-binding protein
MKMNKKALIGFAVACGDSGRPPSRRQEQFIGLPSYRVGPYAAGGTGIFGGMIDYMKLINERDGGINGVKLTWEECETEYNNARGVECYERMKKKGPTGNTVFQPLSTGITYSVLDKVAQDKIPVISLGYGRTDAADGRVFPYVFPLITNYWSQNTAIDEVHRPKKGGMDKLKGKKIVHIYHDSAYGKETIAGARRPGQDVWLRTVKHIPCPPRQRAAVAVAADPPGQARLGHPAGWGVMNPTALKAAAKIGFPREKIVGVWWSGAEEDTIPAGDAAKGYISAGFNVAGTNYPVIKDIKKHVVRQGQGQHGGQVAHRQRVLQPRRGARHHHRRGDPQGAGEVRQGQVDHRRADALGHREPEHRRGPPEGSAPRASCRR